MCAIRKSANADAHCKSISSFLMRFVKDFCMWIYIDMAFRKVDLFKNTYCIYLQGGFLQNASPSLYKDSKKYGENDHVCISVSTTSIDWHQGNVLPHQWHASVSARERPHIHTWGISECTIQTAGGGERDLSLHAFWVLQQFHRITIFDSPMSPSVDSS